MLWNQIYDFFVKFIFGGYGTDGNLYEASLGYSYDFDSDDVYPYLTGDFWVFKPDNQQNVFLSFGNYLSLIASIITIVVIVLFCVFIIKKIIGIIFRLFTGSSAF